MIIPHIDDVTRSTIEEESVKENVPLELLYNPVTKFISENGIPAEVVIGELITNSGFFGKGRTTKPCIVIVHNDKSSRKSNNYYSFGIITEFEYGLTHIKLFAYGESTLAKLRSYDPEKNLYAREWESESRYYGAVKRAFNSIFD